LKFSLRGTVAMALLGLNTADAAAFSDGLAHNSALAGIRDRVTVVTDASLPATASIVTVIDTDGRTHSSSQDAGTPDRDLGRQGERLTGKFHALANAMVGPAAAHAMQSKIQQLEQLPTIQGLVAVHAGVSI
jgi:hypothetical protein